MQTAFFKKAGNQKNDKQSKKMQEQFSYLKTNTADSANSSQYSGH